MGLRLVAFSTRRPTIFILKWHYFNLSTLLWIMKRDNIQMHRMWVQGVLPPPFCREGANFWRKFLWGGAQCVKINQGDSWKGGLGFLREAGQRNSNVHFLFCILTKVMSPAFFRWWSYFHCVWTSGWRGQNQYYFSLCRIFGTLLCVSSSGHI